MAKKEAPKVAASVRARSGLKVVTKRGRKVLPANPANPSRRQHSPKSGVLILTARQKLRRA